MNHFIEDLKEKYRMKRVLTRTLQLGLVILCVFFIVALIPHVKENGENIVISFIGILATFVVIGNYSQVSHIIDENRRYQDAIRKQIEKLEDDWKEKMKDTNNEIQELKCLVKNDDGTSKIDEILKLKEKFDFSSVEKRMMLNYQNSLEYINRLEYTSLIEAMLYLIQGEQRVLVSNIINDIKDKKYHVKQVGHADIIRNVTIVWNGSRLIFINAEGHFIENIEKVSNKNYDDEKVNNILSVLLKYSDAHAPQYDNRTMLETLYGSRTVETTEN